MREARLLPGLLRWIQVAKVGVEGLKAHPLRSVLTTLGVVCGVAAVIAMLAVGEGAKRAALAKYQGWGSDNVIVRDVATSSEARRGKGAAISRGLTLADAQALAEVIPTARVVVPQVDRPVTISAGSEEVEGLLVATTPQFPLVSRVRVAQGRFLHPLDETHRSRVCVVGSTVARALFPLASPLGQRVKIQDQWFTVVGVTERFPQVAGSAGVLQARDLNKDVYVPLATERARRAVVWPASELTQITVKVSPRDAVRPTAVAVGNLLRRRHWEAQDFGLVVPEELIQEEQREQRMFNVVLGAIAAISLLVGGIGIMNIMLASVLERRREIGIRRAVGARARDIVGQFVAEAAAMSLVGGVLGILVGLTMAGSIHLVTQFRAVPTMAAIAVAFGVSVLVGVVFGYYPARRAASVQPMEVLRYE